MNSQLQTLVALQRVDLRLHAIKEQQEKIPHTMKQAEACLQEVTKRYNDLMNAAGLLVSRRRSAEQELADHEEHIKKLKTRLTELKTNKEYQAHLFEIDVANKKKDALEEEVLLALDNTEHKQKEVVEMRQRVTEAEQQFAEQRSHLEQLHTLLSNEFEELQNQQQEVLRILDNRVKGRYANLKSLGKDLAVVPVRNGACVGCRLQLPPQLVAEVKRSEDLLECAFCHRILYWEEAIEEKTTCVISADNEKGRMDDET